MRFLLAYVRSKCNDGKDVGDLDIYSKEEFDDFQDKYTNVVVDKSMKVLTDDSHVDDYDDNNEEMTDVSHNFDLGVKNNVSTLLINYVTYNNCPNKNQLRNVSVSSAFVADSHYDRFGEADFYTAVLADGKNVGCKNVNDNDTNCSLIDDDSHANNFRYKNANDNDTNHSLIDDDFHEVAFIDQEATKFLDSSTKFEILLYRMIDNHVDAFTQKLYEDCIFDILLLAVFLQIPSNN